MLCVPMLQLYTRMAKLWLNLMMQIIIMPAPVELESILTATLSGRGSAKNMNGSKFKLISLKKKAVPYKYHINLLWVINYNTMSLTSPHTTLPHVNLVFSCPWNNSTIFELLYSTYFFQANSACSYIYNIIILWWCIIVQKHHESQQIPLLSTLDHMENFL